MIDFTIGNGSSVIIGFYLGGTGFGLKKRWYTGMGRGSGIGVLLK